MARVHAIFTALLAVFLLCVSAGERIPILLALALVPGAAMAGLLVLRWFRTGILIPLEMVILCLFAVWAIGSGCLVAVDKGLFGHGVERLIQVVLLAACVSSMAAVTRTPASGFYAVTMLAVVLVGYGFLSGDFAAAAEMTRKGDRIVGHRAMSLTSNANSLGLSCVWALAGLALLWRKTNRLFQQIFLTCLALPLLGGAVASGSRKAVLLVPIFLLAWGWFCYRSVILRKGRVFLGCSLAAVMMVFAAVYVMQDTFAGQRLRQVLAGEKNWDSSTESRMLMVREGLQMLSNYALTGVGLNQYTAHSSLGSYAHNDYVEVAANTGLVGFCIYYSLFGVVTWRLMRVRRESRHPEVIYVAGVCLAVLVTCAAAGFTLVMVSSFAFWCFISGVVGFAYVSERDALRMTHGPGRLVRPVAAWRPMAAGALVRHAGIGARVRVFGASRHRLP